MIARLRKYFKSKNESKITLLGIFKPLYVILTLFGLFPCNLKYKTKDNCFIHRSIYVNSLCAVSIILMVLLFLFLHVRGILLLTEGSSLSDAIMTEINYILELINLTIFCLISYYCAFIYRYKYIYIVNTLASTWFELPKRNDNILKNLKVSVARTLLCILFLLLLQLAVNFTRHDSLWKKILVTFSFNLPQMIQFLVLAFYYVLLLMDIALLMSLKENLRTFLTDSKFVPDCFTVLSNLRGEKKYTMINLRSLEVIFVKAFDIKRSINEVFEAPILITAIQSFHSMVGEAHIIYHGAIIQKALTTHEIINCSVWIGYQLFKMYILAYSGNLLKVVILQVGQTLHNVPLERHDFRSLLEIQHFASLMKYHATDLTVYGYFPLDATLIFKIAASATMYLIILVQLDKKV